MRVMKRGVDISILTVFSLFAVFTHAMNKTGDYGIGVNYPGVGFRYFINNRVAIEGRAQRDEEVLAGGLRGILYAGKLDQVFFYGGLEVDRLWVRDVDRIAGGWATSVFIGGEVFVSKRLAVNVDFGPTLFKLQDNGIGVENSTVEPVVNIGMIYFIGGKP
jgi:hypothetical protein